MTRCIIHTGMPKSGSTAIQETLFTNRAAFLKHHSIHYFGHAENHSELRRDLKFRVLSAEQRKRHSDAPTGILAALEKSLPQVKADYFVISGEALGRMRDDTVPRLKQIIAPYVDDIQIIIYAREPYGFANSMAQQHLKNGASFERIKTDTFRTGPNVGHSRNPAASLVPQYRFRMEKFRKTFGAGRVKICEFDRAKMKGQDVVDDFLWHAFGLDDLVFPLGQNLKNTSMDQAAALCLEAANREIPLFIDGATNPARARSLVVRLADSPRRQKFQLPDFDFARFKTLIEPDILWLKKITNGRIDFTGPPPDMRAAAHMDDYTGLAKMLNNMAMTADNNMPAS